MRSRRAVSPAVSENEVDILDSIYTDDGGRIDAQDGMAFDAEDIFGGGARGGPGYDDDDDGDEAFIALTQAASFRKTGNLKSKSAKKGGGFQSMGKPTFRFMLRLSSAMRDEKLTVTRPECQSATSHHPQRFLRTYAYPTKSDSLNSREERSGGYGPDRFWKDCCFRHPHDREAQSP